MVLSNVSSQDTGTVASHSLETSPLHLELYAVKEFNVNARNYLDEVERCHFRTRLSEAHRCSWYDD
jgi:hypothetical protein